MFKTSKYLFTLFTMLSLSITASYAACTPAGTTGDDTVSCSGVINSFQYFYGGSDMVTLNHVSALTTNNVYWLDEALGGNPVTDGNDTFISHNSQFHWVLGFGGDDTFQIDHSKFNNAYGDTNPLRGFGNRGNDTFLIEHSTSYGYILGGNDNDIITIIESNVSNVASGYSDIYGNIDYTPFDGNDTILLDHVNFNAPLYWDNIQIEGVVTGGRGNDRITFQNGGEAYYIYGGHGSDIIEVYDNEHFNACTSSHQITDRCGIYGDESYASEPNATAIPLLHGDDQIILHNGDVSGILVQGGDGSDLVKIHTPVILANTRIDGGDDRNIADGFTDQLLFDQWSGEINGSNIVNWEQIILDNNSVVTFSDINLSTGYADGISPQTLLPYGLILQNHSTLKQYHDFTVDGNLYNNAMIDMQDGNTPGTTLIVNHNYTSDHGKLYLDVTLNDALPNITDKLLIKADASGTTTLFVNNINGSGGATPEGKNRGILVVKIEGDSNAVFKLDQVLEAGDYWYSLYKGNNGNWYLRSEKKVPSLTVTEEVNSTTISAPTTLEYTFTVSNSGNVPLTHIILNDHFPNGSSATPLFQSGDENGNSVLDVGEVWVYTLEYNVTQNEINTGADIINRISVTSDETGIQVNASATTNIQPYRSTISGYFWLDSDHDGIQDSGETFLGNAVVELLDAQGNPVNDIYGNHTTTTDMQGSYHFDVLPDRTYQIHFIIPHTYLTKNYIFTVTNRDGNTLGSDVDSRGYTQPVTVQTGRNYTHYDAGINCGCSQMQISSNGGSTLTLLSGFILTILTLLSALFFRRKEIMV